MRHSSDIWLQENVPRWPWNLGHRSVTQGHHNFPVSAAINSLVTVLFLLHRGHRTVYHLPSELFHPSPPFSNSWRHICLGSVLPNFLLPSSLLLCGPPPYEGAAYCVALCLSVCPFAYCLSVRPVIVFVYFTVEPSYERTSKIEKLRFPLMGQRHLRTFRHAQRAAYRTAISAAQTCYYSVKCPCIIRVIASLKSVHC